MFTLENTTFSLAKVSVFLNFKRLPSPFHFFLITEASFILFGRYVENSKALGKISNSVVVEIFGNYQFSFQVFQNLSLLVFFLFWIVKMVFCRVRSLAYQVGSWYLVGRLGCRSEGVFVQLIQRPAPSPCVSARRLLGSDRLLRSTTRRQSVKRHVAHFFSESGTTC